MKQQKLSVDLQQGVLPISAAASHLAALIKQARATGQPIIVTQKGYPTGVILDVETFTALRELAERVAAEEAQGATTPADVCPVCYHAYPTDEPADVPHSLRLPEPGRCTIEWVSDHQAEHLVHIRFRFNGRDYALDMPYTLRAGGRGYTWAGVDLPGPTLRNGDQASRPLDDTEINTFRDWCTLAEAALPD